MVADVQVWLLVGSAGSLICKAGCDVGIGNLKVDRDRKPCTLWGRRSCSCRRYHLAADRSRDAIKVTIVARERELATPECRGGFINEPVHVFIFPKVEDLT